LLLWARAGFNARSPDQKSFLVLFYKKEAFLPSHQNHISRRRPKGRSAEIKEKAVFFL